MKAPLYRKIAAYGVGAGAAALAAPAQADIHYSGALDFTADTIYSILPTLWARATTCNWRITSSLPQRLGKNGEKPTAYGLTGSTGAGEVAIFKPDFLKFATPEFGNTDTIGSQAFGNEGYFNDFNASTPGGQWQVGDTGFLGLQITINGQIDFGWAEVRLNSASPVSSSSSSLAADVADGQFTLLGYAFQDSGAPIQAGAIPEPSSLALLALGATGVVALRRRRK